MEEARCGHTADCRGHEWEGKGVGGVTEPSLDRFGCNGSEVSLLKDRVSASRRVMASGRGVWEHAPPRGQPGGG